MPRKHEYHWRRARGLCVECSAPVDVARCPECKRRERLRERRAGRARSAAGRPGSVAAASPRLPERERDLLVEIFADGLAGKNFRPGGREFREAAARWIREISMMTGRPVGDDEAAGLLADSVLLVRAARSARKGAFGASPAAIRVASILVRL